MPTQTKGQETHADLSALEETRLVASVAPDAQQERQHTSRADQPIESADNFDELLRFADRLIGTGFVPNGLKSPEQVVAIILTGRELGMSSMASLRRFHIVEGHVTEAAASMLARFKQDGGRSEFRELTDDGATLWLRHANGDEHLETWTVGDSERAGLLAPNKYGKHGNHVKFPRAMFRSRCIANGLRSLGWHGAIGIYDPGEMIGIRDEYDAEHIARAALNESDMAERRAAPLPERDNPTADATNKQLELLSRLLRSRVFTDNERKYSSQPMNRSRASKAIEWAKSELQLRKAAEAHKANEDAPQEVFAREDADDARELTEDDESLARALNDQSPVNPDENAKTTL